MDELLVGRVTHFFQAIQVAAVEITAEEIRLGDIIRITGRTSEFVQEVRSMQVDHRAVERARTGERVAIELVDRARVNDLVFRTLPHPL
jgi:hypothetical protein